MNRFILTISLILLTSCQTKPTRIYEGKNPDYSELNNLNQNIQLTNKTVLIDARPRFENALTRPVGSTFLAWDSFSEPGSKYVGRLQLDLQSAVNRLAAIGIGPDSHVVIVGPGVSGTGAEGRLAWMLMYLGVKNVQVASIEHLKFRFSSSEEPPKSGVPTWSLSMNQTLIASSKELKSIVRKNRTGREHIIDVRSAKEYFARDIKTERYLFPDLQALNIEWKEFFLIDGKINAQLKSKLEAVGIQNDHRIIVISNHGVRSAAVVYALRRLGFNNSANFAGGWEELLDR